MARLFCHPWSLYLILQPEQSLTWKSKGRGSLPNTEACSPSLSWVVSGNSKFSLLCSLPLHISKPVHRQQNYSSCPPPRAPSPKQIQALSKTLFNIRHHAASRAVGPACETSQKECGPRQAEVESLQFGKRKTSQRCQDPTAPN